MIIAVKYCGGCNPRFDRGALVKRLREEFPRAAFTGVETPAPDFVLVVTGCPSQCASHENLQGRYGKLVITTAEEYEKAREELARVEVLTGGTQ